MKENYKEKQSAQLYFSNFLFYLIKACFGHHVLLFFSAFQWLEHEEDWSLTSLYRFF